MDMKQPNFIAFSQVLVDFTAESLNPAWEVLYLWRASCLSFNLDSFCDKFGGKLPASNIEFYVHNSSMSSLSLPCVFCTS